MTITDEIDAYIAIHGGSARDALNIVLFERTQLLEAIRRTEQTCRNLVEGGFVHGDAREILCHEAASLRAMATAAEMPPAPPEVRK